MMGNMNPTKKTWRLKHPFTDNFLQTRYGPFVIVTISYFLSLHFNMSNMTVSTGGAGITYPPRASSYFMMISIARSFDFCAVLCKLAIIVVVLTFFFLVMVLSIYDLKLQITYIFNMKYDHIIIIVIKHFPIFQLKLNIHSDTCAQESDI